VIIVNPARHPHVKKELGQAFVQTPRSERVICDSAAAAESLPVNAGAGAGGTVLHRQDAWMLLFHPALTARNLPIEGGCAALRAVRSLTSP
jgi:hypothetical protein